MTRQQQLTNNMNDSDEEVGLICTRCGCRHFYVVYTRRLRNNTIMRRKECRHCGKRITTHESTKS